MLLFKNDSQKTLDFSALEIDVSEVTKNIYLGDKTFAKNIVYLKKLQIKHIVVAGEQLEAHYPLEFNYLHLKIKDSVKQKIGDSFNRVFEFMETGLRKGENVYIHCAYGVSRSATLLIAYLMKKLNIGYSQAYCFVRKKRSQIRPNQGFVIQLKQWERIMGAKTMNDFNEYL